MAGTSIEHVVADAAFGHIIAQASKKNVVTPLPQKASPRDPWARGQFGYGDVWTWTAICADTKVVPCWLVGRRDADAANEFMEPSRSAGKPRTAYD